MKFVARCFTVFTLLISQSTQAEKIAIMAESELEFALDEIVASRKLARPGQGMEVVCGLSGKFWSQIREGAPYDLSISADIAFPRELAKAGLTASQVERYALGRIAQNMDSTQIREVVTKSSFVLPGDTAVK